MTSKKFKYLKFIFLNFIIIIILFGCGSKDNNRASESGYVVKVIDGDTYDILLDGKQTRIRMYGIDAPERGMDFYKVSKEYLGALCRENLIRIEKINTDRYGRTIAKSFLPNGHELGAEMIKAGLAWHFKKYSNDKDLAEFEIIAREKMIGLWSIENPTPPWDYRKRKRGN